MAKRHWPRWRSREVGISMAPVFDMGLMFRVRHEGFDSKKVYQAIIWQDFGPAADPQVLFINDMGLPWWVPQTHIICVNQHVRRPALPTELELYPFPTELPESDWT